jgi:hypothetical protein
LHQPGVELIGVQGALLTLGEKGMNGGGFPGLGMPLQQLLTGQSHRIENGS